MNTLTYSAVARFMKKMMQNKNMSTNLFLF